MESIDKLMSHFKNRFPKGNWDKVGDNIKKRYEEFISVNGGGKNGKRSKSTSASMRRGLEHAARAAIQRILSYGRGRTEVRFGPEALENFNRFINTIIGDVPPGARAQMTLLQRAVDMTRSTDYEGTSGHVQENLFTLFCTDFETRDGIIRQNRLENKRIDSENWARNAFMSHRIWMSRLTFAFGIYAAYWAYHRFNRPTAIAQEIVESVLAFGSYRRNKPTAAAPPLPTPEQLLLPCTDGFFTCGYNSMRGVPSPSQIPDAPTELPQLPAPNRTTIQAIGDWLSRTAGSALSGGKRVGGALFYVLGSLQDIIEELVDLGAILPGLAAGLIAFLFFTIISLAMLYGFSICGVSVIPQQPQPPQPPPPPPPPRPDGQGDRSDQSASEQRQLAVVTGGRRRRRRKTGRKKRKKTHKKIKRKRRKTKRKRNTMRKKRRIRSQIGCSKRKKTRRRR